MSEDKKKYDFKVFEDARRSRGNPVKASITRSGNIYLNKRFRDENWDSLEGAHVVFHYDEGNRTIGLQFVYAIAPNAYPVRELPGGKGLIIFALSFLKRNGIPFKKTRSFEIKRYDSPDGSDFFIINLGEDK